MGGRGERQGPDLEGPVFLAQELFFIPSGMGRCQGRYVKWSPLRHMYCLGPFELHVTETQFQLSRAQKVDQLSQVKCRT